jgi:hypothetical protein
MPIVKQEVRADGGLRVTVLLDRPAWQRWLGGSEKVGRTFGLDNAGRQVYEACDGRRNARAIIRRFAAANRLNEAEAEIAVTTFLKTLMAKGLVAMEVERKKT